MKTKIVICCGINRSGSTWTYLVTQELMINRSHIDLGFREPNEFNLVYEYIGKYEYILLKMHHYPKLLNEIGTEDVYLIYSHRDLRGIYTSLMEKERVGFQKAIKFDFIEKSISDYQNWKKHKQIIFVKYSDIVTSSEDEVKHITEFIGITGVDSQKIAENNSMKKNIEKIEKFKASWNVKLKILLQKLKIFKNLKNEDNLLHYNHINNGDVFNWRNRLKKEEENVIFLKYRFWMDEFGYHE